MGKVVTMSVFAWTDRKIMKHCNSVS